MQPEQQYIGQPQTAQTIQQTPQFTQQAPKQGMSTGVKVLLGILGCGFILCLIASAIVAISVYGVGQATKKVSQNIEKSGKVDDENFAKPKNIGTTISFEDSEWKITEAKNLETVIKTDSEYGKDCTATEGTRFIKIKYSVKNIGKDAVNVAPPKIVDAEKKYFTNFYDIYSCISNYDIKSSDTLNPEQTEDFEAYYQIPTASKDLKVEVDNLKLFTSTKQYVSLGL